MSLRHDPVTSLATRGDDPAVVGGKAARLEALRRRGHSVPPFVVLDGSWFEGSHVPLAGGALARLLGPGPYAVRSSATTEDGAESSHAGQFLSLLDVAPADLWDAVSKVRASGDAEGVAAYRALRGQAGGAPAVIVQAMVRARAAGVAFSADPVSGRRDVAVVSAVSGLADALVGGERDGDDLRYDRVLRRVMDGRVPQVLTPAEVEGVVALVERLEAEEGGPQDVEWAFDEEGLKVLQTRPVTTRLRPAALPDGDVAVLDNSNVVESYPGLVSPLTFSFAVHAYSEVYRAFVTLLGVPRREVEDRRALFANMLTRVDGRVFYRLDNWYRAIAMLPGYRLNRGFMEGMMGVDEPMPRDLAEALGPPPAVGARAVAGEWWRVARTGAGLLLAAARLGRTERDFMGRLRRACADTGRADVDRLPLVGLAVLYRRIEADLLDRWDAPLVNDFLCMMAFGASRALLGRWAGPGGAALHDAYMIGQGNLVSAEPAERIRRMGALVADRPGLVASLARGLADGIDAHPDVRREVDAYLDRFGDRCAEELKLESPTLHDDPSPLLMAVAGAARSPRADVTRADPEAALRDALSGSPFRRAALTPLMRYARARVRGRENLRFERTRIFGAARRVLLAMGRQLHARGALEDPRDVLMLTVPEVLGAVEGGGVDRDLAGLAALRRAEAARDALLPDPPHRITVRGAVALGASVPPTVPASAGDDARRTGKGCAPGRVTGTARVVTDPRSATVASGEVLVARHTDPGWIALFANAGAVVAERGSPLSHSAIVSRELGIPCVVGLADATRWIRDGERVSVDGGTGVVERLDG